MTDTCETKRRKIDTDEDVETSSQCYTDEESGSSRSNESTCFICYGVEYWDDLEICCMCEEQICEDCTYVIDPEHFAFMSWDELRILFIARCKEKHSGFYKNVLPFDIFEFILGFCGITIQAQAICNECGTEYEDLRRGLKARTHTCLEKYWSFLHFTKL